MTDQQDSVKVEAQPLFEVWKKYEDVAMHFNDLLIRLRTQALGAVAAISAIVGLFTKTSSPDAPGTWQIAAIVMFIMCWLWVALWVLDLLYYNRLLLGSVAAILDIEERSKTETTIKQLNLSTKIADAVVGVRPLVDNPPAARFVILKGVWIFYTLVFALLVGLFAFCLFKHFCSGH